MTRTTALLIIVGLLMLCGCTEKGYQLFDRYGNRRYKTDYKAPEYHLISKTKQSPGTGEVRVVFTADQQDGLFYRIDGERMSSFYVSGVNMGLSDATTDLNDPNISYETYMEWFGLIKKMHANTVRVFTEMPPQFYQALLDYNQQNGTDPLYLIHGIWFPEDYMWGYPVDAFDDDGVVVRAFKKSVKEIVDVVHGNCEGISYGAQTDVRYVYDVSPWLVGYILGLEWSADFVDRTNTHSNLSKYEGEYLRTTPAAAPFEAFLCRVGDTLIAHETRSYQTQVPVAFLNWMTTDTLIHSNEPYEEEDQASVDTETIVATDRYFAGLYAALDIYPYYPEFINYQPEYCNYTDPLTGRQNNYKAYLLDLKKEYTIPVLVAEFGVPTSRGIASKSAIGYHQGGLTEQEQGKYVSNMIVDIASAGYAGGLIFSWQDEWFKQTWNTFRYGSESASRRTPNVMSAEQNYGILAMLPGDTDIITVDGKIDEWTDEDIICETDDAVLSAKYDEGYLYFAVALKKRQRFDNTELFIPISTLGVGSHSYSEAALQFDNAVDFILCLNGKENSMLLVDEYYDFFQYRYGWIMGWIVTDNDFGQKDTGKYVCVNQWVTGELVLPQTKQTIEPIIFEAGKLLFGNTDPNSKEYDSLADFCYRKDTLEIRIPWYLLNVLNSTEGVCINDFMKDNAEGTTTLLKVSAGVALKGDTVKLASVGWKEKDTSEFHTRLKRSYDIISETLLMLHSD